MTAAASVAPRGDERARIQWRALMAECDEQQLAYGKHLSEAGGWLAWSLDRDDNDKAFALERAMKEAAAAKAAHERWVKALALAQACPYAVYLAVVRP